MTTITLECGCDLTFPTRPRKWELLHCHTHDRLTGIQQELGLWEVSCMDCGYVRHSVGELTARTKAAHHMCGTYHTVRSWRVGDYHATCNTHASDQRVTVPPGTIPF